MLRIVILERKRFAVAAVLDEDGRCPVLDFLEGESHRYEAAASGMLDLLCHIAGEGLDGLSSKLCHQVSKKHKIYQLTKGRLRLLFFKGRKGIVLVGSHLFVKDSRRTPADEIERARRCRQSYLQALEDGSLIIEEDP